MSHLKGGEGASFYISDVLGKAHQLRMTLYGMASCRVFPLAGLLTQTGPNSVAIARSNITPTATKGTTDKYSVQLKFATTGYMVYIL